MKPDRRRHQPIHPDLGDVCDTAVDFFGLLVLLAIAAGAAGGFAELARLAARVIGQ